MHIKIDLNCDMGEGMENDALLMPYISSANIACGAHAGDIETMLHTVELCIKHGVAIGAHPGFEDKENFGRNAMELDDETLYDLVYKQVKELQQICMEKKVKMHHVKPHGALYNMAAKNYKMAEIIAQAVQAVQPDLILYGLSSSCMIDAAQKVGLQTANEVFADRTYQKDGSLVSRLQQGAVITDEEQSLQQVLTMITKQQVKTIDGEVIMIQPDTLCLHGDGVHAVAFAKKIRNTLTLKNIGIETI